MKTFSIGFEEQDYSELEHARRVAKHLGTDHHELVVRPRALDLLPRLVWALDEPFADPSMIPTFYVAEMARRHVAVALSGDGGDEAYAGYSSYLVSRRYARMDHLPRLLRRALAWPSQWLHSEHAVGRRLRRTGLDVVGRHLDGMSVYMLRELDFLLAGDLRSSLANHDPHAHAREVHEQAARGIGDLPALLYLDAMTYLSDDILVKVDRTAMQHSLEVRVPLIDHKVMEFVARIPFEYKLRGVQSKWILRECVKDLLPSEILARGKQGFDVPLERWFGDDFGRLAREVLYDPRARSRGWLDEQAVESLIERPHAPGARQARQVWALTCLELWAQTYLDRDVASADRPLTAVPAPSHSTAVPSAT